MKINSFLLRRLLPLSLLLLALAGCQSAAPEEKKAAVFYPQPPDAPRLQYLTSFSGEQDLVREVSKFQSFVVGKQVSNKLIAKPYGVALHDNKLYVCDVGLGSIDILDLKDRSFRYFAPGGEGKLVTPINIAVDRDGTRYVADTSRGQVLIYGADGQYRGAIGTKPAPPAEASVAPGAVPESMKPSDVVVAGNRLFISDLQSHLVHVYDKTKRERLFTVPNDPAKAEPRSQLFSPVNMALDTQGRLYVSDLGSFRVQQYDADGRYLRTFGLGAGDRPGEFTRPKGVAVDRDGRVYVVDAASQVVQIFDEQGRLLLFFGEMQNGNPGLDLPSKIIIDYEHVALFQSYAAPGFHLEYLVLVTSQFGERKVSVFGFGHNN